MDWRSIRFDWNHARAFLVTAEEGSLSAAARALGLAQPTLGRQVSALERELGVTLFDRVGRSLVLTPEGVALAEQVRAMGEAAGRVSLTASGQSRTVEGTVRITATEVASAFVLPPILARLRQAEPGIALEIAATNSLRDLARREADIALRSVRPSDPELIARRVGTGTARLYAAASLLDRLGGFDGPEALSRAPFVGFEDNESFLEALNARGLALAARSFVALTASHLVHWELVRAGLGVGVMVTQVGDADPAVRRAAPWLAPFGFETWLVARRELNTSRRVRLVFDRLAAELAAA